MKTFSRKNTVAAVVLAAATVGLPTLAQAGHATTSSYRYEDCKKSDTSGQILGGLLGAVVGGVAGSEIAGRGDRHEGTAIGAVVGAAAGIAIADKDCKNRAGYRTGSSNTYYPSNTSYPSSNRNYGTTYRTGYGTTYRTGSGSTYGNTYGGGYRTVTHPSSNGRGNAYGHRNHNHNSGYNSGYSRNGYNSGSSQGYRQYTPYTGRSHTCTSGETSLQHIEWKIDELRRERDYLERQRRYAGYDRNLERRMYEIGNEIGRLKEEKKYVKDYGRNNHNYYYKTKR